MSSKSICILQSEWFIASKALYTENKYTRLYHAIILDALSNPPNGETENHHIIPRCMGGHNRKSNIAALSIKQHRICHKLLLKMLAENTRPKIKRYLKVALNRF
jgi:hypothetical protein